MVSSLRPNLDAIECVWTGEFDLNAPRVKVKVKVKCLNPEREGCRFNARMQVAPDY